jgi:hypothetical protein
MKEIGKLNKLHLQFVVPEFQKDFDQQIFDVYMKSNSQEPPHVLDWLLIALTHDKPEVFFSAKLGIQHLNKHYYFDLMENASERDKHNFLLDQLSLFEMKKALGDKSEGPYEHMMYQDLLTVLNYYNMSFVDIVGAEKFGGKFYKNMPSGQVW